MKLETRHWAQYLIIALVGIMAYSNTFCVPFIFDDKTSIVENPAITDLSRFLSGEGVAYNARRFVGYLSFALNYSIGGLDVTGYHVVNLGIHIFSACLVALLLRLTLQTPLFQKPHITSGKVCLNSLGLLPLLAALLFVAHPIQTQAVTYIVQRLASLASMFYLLSLVLYLKARLVTVLGETSSGTGNTLRSGLTCYAGALLAALCALATKEIAFTLPFAVALYELCFFDTLRSRRRALMLALIIGGVAVAGAVIAAQQPLGELISDVSQRLRLQTEMPRWHYFLTQCTVIVTYLRLLFLPIGQNLDYDYPVYTSLLQPQVLFSCILLLLFCGLAIYLYLRVKPIVKGTLFIDRPEMRLISFGIFWFFITLSIESSVIPIEDVIFEHRMYLPSVGAFLVLASVMVLFVRSGRRGVTVFATVIVLLLASVTWGRNLTWKDGITFWTDVVEKSPSKARAHLNLGVELEAKGRSQEAIAAFGRALSLNPDYRQAYGNLGAAYNSLEAFEEAIVVLQEGLRRYPGDPDLCNNLGISFAAKGSPELAVAFFEAAVRLAPQIEKYRLNLATAQQETAQRQAR